MKKRFEGPDGQRLLIGAIQKQDLIQYNADLAAAIVDGGELVEFQPGENIVVQGDTDNAVFFLLSGDAQVFVNKRFFGTRSEGTSIGEMAAIDPAAPRSTTVQANSTVVALRVLEAKFTEALDAHPTAYKSVAQLVARRLRQRSTFVEPPNVRPVLFIGCSAEALSIANELQSGFKHDQVEAIVWPNGVFGPSGVAFDSLASQAVRSDFAAFVISSDDRVISRGNDEPAPRDNVIFELGLFMGKLDDRTRVFLVQEHGTDVKIPSDLLGITPVTYVVKSGNLAATMGPACNEIRKVIGERGVR